MAYRRDITADDKCFYDTDFFLDFRIWQGNPTTAEILAGTAVPQDITGWALGWTLRRTPSTADPALIYKTTEGSPADVSILGVFDPDPTLNTQKARVRVRDTDTYDPSVSPVWSIKAGKYAHGLKRLDEDQETVLTWGSFVLLQAAPWEAP